MKGLIFLCGFIVLAENALSAESIVTWTFNSVPPDSPSNVGTGTKIPANGTGAASYVGGATNASSGEFAAGDSRSDPAGGADNSAWNTSKYPSAITGNKSAGVQFEASTLGYSNIVVSWSQQNSATASRYLRVQYTTDGSTFQDGPSVAVYVDGVFTNKVADLSGIPETANNPNFAVRFVSEWEFTAINAGTNAYVATKAGSSYSTSGTMRFDMVTIAGALLPNANTAPTISSFTNSTLRVNQTSSAMPFTITDAEDDPSILTLTAESSDQAVVPGNNLVFGGAGANRNLMITAGSQPGTTVITIFVSDSQNKSNSTAFQVTVLPANTAPSILVSTLTNTLVNRAVDIPFIVGDAEMSADALQVSAVSSNVALVPNGNFVFSGAGSNRSVTITPAADQNGCVPITLLVSDGTNVSTALISLGIVPFADLLLYEPFAYPDGSLLTNSGFLWANRSGTIVGQTQIINGQLLVTSAQTEDVVAPLVGGPYQKNKGTVLYASFKGTWLSLPKISPGLFASFASGSTLRGRVYSGTTNATAGSFRLAVANGSDASSQSPTDLNTNVTYTVVTRYDIDTASTTLWVNPIAESDPGIAGTDLQTANTISTYGFRQDADIGASILIDELRIGFSFSAVTAPITGQPQAPRISVATYDRDLVLSWLGANYSLQAAPQASGAFTNIPGASSPYTNFMDTVQLYFRLKAN